MLAKPSENATVPLSNNSLRQHLTKNYTLPKLPLLPSPQFGQVGIFFLTSKTCVIEASYDNDENEQKIQITSKCTTDYYLLENGKNFQARPLRLALSGKKHIFCGVFPFST